MSFYSHLPLEELVECVSRNPQEVELRLALVERHVENKDFDGALVHIQNAEELAPDDPEVIAWKSMSMIFNGQLEHGHELLQQVVRNNPCCDFQMKLVSEIVPLFTGEAVDPTQVDWFSTLSMEPSGWSTKFVERTSSFIEAVDLLQEDSQRGIPSLEAHIEQFPTDINARLYLAIIYCSIRNFTDAATVYRQVIEMDDECSTAYFELAAIIDDPQQAVELTRKGLQCCPFAMHARYNLGMFLMQLEDYAAARRELTRIPADSSIYVDALIATGMAFEDEGDIPGAIECLEKAVLLKPERADIRGKYGQLLCDCGWNEEALQELELAIEMDPCQHGVWANKGLLHLFLGHHEQAQDALQESLRLNPQSEDAAINLAVLLAETDRVEEGIAILNEAIHFHPDHPLICQNLGALYCNTRDLDRALFYTNRSIELGIDTPAVYWNLANIFCFRRDRDKCLENLAMAIHLDETFAGQFQMDEDFREYWSDPDFVSLINGD